MLQAFYTGNSGLNANKTWLSVISDNIANVNTVGYKQESANFQDLISSSLTTYSTSGVPKNTEIGGGSFVSSTLKDFSQGTFKTSNSPLSLALDGEGFFMVKNPTADLTYYTRAGDFRIDANGDVINQNGYRLQGWTLGDDGKIAGAVGSINVPRAIDPKTTTKVSFESPANLDADSAAISETFDPSDSTTYSYVNTTTTYDSLGTSHTLKHYYVKIATNMWRVFTQMDDRGVTYSKYAGIELAFDDKGKLKAAQYVGKTTKKTNDTADENNDTGEFTISETPVLPGSIYITKNGDKSVKWNDDGSGNIIDIDTGEIVGSVSYDDGKITIPSDNEDGTSGSSGSLTLNYTNYSISANVTGESDNENSSDNGVYNLQNSPVTPKTIKITKHGTDNVDWEDDGQGNIVDKNNNDEVVGSVDYSKGQIAINEDANDGGTNLITVEYYSNKISDDTKIKTDTIDYSNVESRFLNTGATSQALTINPVNLTQLSSDFIFYAQQNGSGKGDLMSMSTTEDGVIKATYTNGQVKDVARLAVATFKDKEMLVRKGDSLYLPNQQTFTPIIVPGGVISKIRSGMLEMSNVDISQEFINLITAQRAYQANAKTITTSDQILQTTMDIKR